MRKRIMAAVAAVACVAVLGLAGCGGSGAAASSAAGSAAASEEAAPEVDPVKSLPIPDLSIAASGTDAEIEKAMEGFYEIDLGAGSVRHERIYSNSKELIDSVGNSTEATEWLDGDEAADGDWMLYISGSDTNAASFNIRVADSQRNQEGYTAVVKQSFDVDEFHESQSRGGSFTVKGNDHVIGWFSPLDRDTTLWVGLYYTDSKDAEWKDFYSHV